MFLIKRRPYSLIIDLPDFGNWRTVGDTACVGRRSISLVSSVRNRLGEVYHHVFTVVISFLAIVRFRILWDRADKSWLDFGFDQVKTHTSRCFFRNDILPFVVFGTIS